MQELEMKSTSDPAPSHGARERASWREIWSRKEKIYFKSGDDEMIF